MPAKMTQAHYATLSKNIRENMKFNSITRRTALGTVGAGLLGAIAGPAIAQTGPYPNKPIKIIVPWAAGGGGDVLVRMFAPGLQQRLGQVIVVENRPGAIGTIGSLAAARSPADGYTILYGSADSHSIAPQVFKQIPYDSKKEFVAVAPIGFPPISLCVHASHPAKTFDQFLKMAREAKEPLTYGSWGPGGSGHITAEALKQAAKIDLLHVPYNGTAPLLQAQLANQVNCAINTLPVVEPHIRTGALRVLAIVAKERLAQFPDVPILKEMGIGIEIGGWIGFLAPAGVPPDILAKLHAAIDATAREPALAEQMKKMTMIPDYQDQRSYQAFYLSEFDRWGQYIRNAKISLDQ